MTRKYCSSCRQDTIQNPMKRKKDEEQRYRCTYCGFPISTNVLAKREYQEDLRQKQVRKASKGLL